MSTQFQGCKQTFIGGNLLRHLRNTKNHACVAYANSIEQPQEISPQITRLLDSLLQSSLTAIPSQEQDQLGALIAVDSSGDFYGDYNDFNHDDMDIGPSHAPIEVSVGHSTGNLLDSESEGSLLSDDDDSELDEDNWEPLHNDSEHLHSPSPRLSRLPPVSRSPLIHEPHIVHYPDPCAGALIEFQGEIVDEYTGLNAWAPFGSKIEWEIARWANLRGPSSTAFTELLAIDGVCEKLGLSYRNANQLNAIIDTLPNIRPKFMRQEVVVQGQVFEMYFRDILECVKSLYGNAEFAEYLNLIPVFLSSDKTQVTLFRNKAVYPVYMTLGNIPKELRRKPSRHTYVLVGYLPVTSLEHIKNAASWRRSLVNLFHTCMRTIVKLLEVAGATGLVIASGDGLRRHGHPIFAAHISDYPEQVLVSCCISGHCPQCTIPRQRIGENTEPHPFRHLRSILEALSTVDHSASAFIKACQDANIKPVFEPFWVHLPYSNVYLAITPDILHQLYQGVFKHMKNWVIEAYGAHEIDACCRRLPPNHNVRIFMKGISTLQRVSGMEHAQICSFLIGLIAETPLPDFLYLSQYPVHSTTTLHSMSDALERFHANKGIFIDLAIRSNFHIPKIHFMNHYVDSIKRAGTLDNFNTEYTERLHIDLAKDAYRATNKKDEILQMTIWLEWKEKVMKHAAYIEWMYGATFFKAVLARFVIQLQRPNLSGARLDDAASGLFLGVSHVSSYHRIKYICQDVFTGRSSTADSIHVQPSRKGNYGCTVPGRFDTVLVNVSDSRSVPLDIRQDTRVAQVRIVFTLPPKAADMLFCDVPTQDRPCFLAYIEWFTPFLERDANHGLHKVSRSNVEGGRLASVVDIVRFLRSVHLLPRFGPVANREWRSSSVLDDCPSFLVNSDSDRHMYQFFASNS
ncbi:hypothetical protein F5050DRAFT_1799862 [Lentinula boryana]|uniref:Uncharacterized protein n=1 Tax=Lentinula boryana TaxID=40481 RepID=A0ABQ8QC38_9AGAR|nr:hypothetical protein F5050DRAFT_1799862 [Lentinula boryana]